MPLVNASPAASLPTHSTHRPGRALSNHFAPVAGFYWFRTHRRREVPPPPLAAAVGVAVRRRGEERRHIVCCCADGQTFRSRSGSNNALPGAILGRRDAMQLPPPAKGAQWAGGQWGSGPMSRQPSAPRRAPLLYHPPSPAGRVAQPPVSFNASRRRRFRRAPRTTRS
jgi:hypothetical protein